MSIDNIDIEIFNSLTNLDDLTTNDNFEFSDNSLFFSPKSIFNFEDISFENNDLFDNNTNHFVSLKNIENISLFFFKY